MAHSTRSKRGRVMARWGLLGRRTVTKTARSSRRKQGDSLRLRNHRGLRIEQFEERSALEHRHVDAARARPNRLWPNGKCRSEESVRQLLERGDRRRASGRRSSDQSQYPLYWNCQRRHLAHEQRHRRQPHLDASDRQRQLAFDWCSRIGSHRSERDDAGRRRGAFEHLRSHRRCARWPALFR